ncbi:cation diffusion facilitator family transporter [Solemya velum gill symbiont]|uniref:cation diffusion facilitator family transporter n=1 Tax=Solemya velum gill symbiont TaxID=2340 RepID=UPI000996438B|nr:cation diffusion facilitator family transporter [Solemya velum gill symbiont]
MHGGHHHHHVARDATPEEASSDRYRQIRRVTLIGAALDLMLGVLKVLVGWLASSQSLIADGVHSFSDLATDFIVLFAAKHGSMEPDEDHPYGHGRFETIATVILGVSLMFVGIGIAWDSINRLFHPEMLFSPGPWALAIALLSVVSKEWIYHYTMRVAKRLRSHMLEANAWHSRTDAISSVIVLVGVGGTMLGLDYLDAIAAIGVSWMVGTIGWKMAWSSLGELSDKGLGEEQLQIIREAIMQQEGAEHVHMLRSRRMGHNALVDVHVEVDSMLTVSEGHMIATAVENAIKESDQGVTDVTVHIDPENDERAPSCDGLPGRKKVLEILSRAWKDAGVDLHWYDVRLHYLGGRIVIDIYLPDAFVGRMEDIERLEEQLKKSLSDLPDFGDVHLYAALGSRRSERD